MRFGLLAAAIVALWIQPAQAAASIVPTGGPGVAIANAGLTEPLEVTLHALIYNGAYLNFDNPNANYIEYTLYRHDNQPFLLKGFQFIGDPSGLLSFSSGSGLSGTWQYGNSTTEYRAQGIIDPARAVPEPSTWAMLMFGFGALGVAIRRKTMARNSLRAIACVRNISDG